MCVVKSAGKLRKMLRVKTRLLLFIAASLPTMLQADSTTACYDDTQCSSGFYCQVDHSCQQCLRCEDLKRESAETKDCIRSFVECGDCFTGLVEDKIVNVCVSPIAEGFLLPVWSIVVISCLVVALFICGVGVWVLRNFQLLKVHQLYRTSVHVPDDQDISTMPALQPPPPYNSVVLQLEDLPAAVDESSWPFIKPVDSSDVPSSSREAAGRQAARVYNNPVYVRGPQLPQSYELPAVIPPEVNHPSERDADTLATDYVADNVIIGAMPEISTVASNAKTERSNQDSNNNSGGGPSAGGGGGGGSESHPPPELPQACIPFIINVIKNVTNVQQNNDHTHTPNSLALV